MQGVPLQMRRIVVFTGSAHPDLAQSVCDILAGHFRDRDLSNTVVVSPDFGRAKDAAYFGRLLGIPVAAGNKQRISDTEVIIDTIVGDVDGKRAIVLDEEIATGGSILTVLDRLSERGVEWSGVEWKTVARGPMGYNPRLQPERRAWPRFQEMQEG